jgi:hypothetical protein
MSSPTYYMNEGAFDLPDGIEADDRTTHVVQVRRQGFELTLVVVRAPLPPGKTIRQIADARVLDEAARLSRYQVLGDIETSWDGCPAVEITSTWRHEGRTIHQRQAHFALGSRAMHFALSTSLDGRAAADEWFEEIRASLRRR